MLYLSADVCRRSHGQRPALLGLPFLTGTSIDAGSEDRLFGIEAGNARTALLKCYGDDGEKNAIIQAFRS